MMRTPLIFTLSLLILGPPGLAAPNFDRDSKWEIKVRDLKVEPPTPVQLEEEVNLWATYYYLPEYNNSESGFPLLDFLGRETGAKLPHKKWCNAALQGSVSIKFQDGRRTVFNYDGFAEETQVDCSPFFKFKRSGKIRYRIANGPYGDGAEETDYILVPYRTIAVDQNVIPYGTVIYIPSARGIKMDLKEGQSFIHDGYFFAADKGSAIKKKHIDVFQGAEIIPGFSKFIKSRPSGRFKAYLIKNVALSSELRKVHLIEKH